MDRPLAGKQILIFVGEVYEDLELWYPKLRLIEAPRQLNWVRECGIDSSQLCPLLSG